MSPWLRIAGAYLLVGVGALCVVTALEARRGLARMDAELAASVSVAWATASRAIIALPVSRRTPEQLREIVRLFDGDRHVSARLTDTDGTIRTVSVPARRSDQAPAWFERVATPPVRPVRFALGGIGGLTVSAEPGHLVDLLWADLLAAAAYAVGAWGAGAAVGIAALRRLARQMAAVARAADRLGAGDPGVRVGWRPEREAALLAARFDAMAEDLAAARDRDARLGAQLAKAHDEERAALARDLHDEIGPLLFAVDVDAAAVGALMDDGPSDRRDGEVRGRARAIRDAAAAMKREVRDILGQLRPGVVLQIGLAQAIHDLVAFWKERHPTVAFTVTVPETGFGPDVDTAIGTVVREAVSNALRHGRPGRIDIEVAIRDGMIRMRVADDGGGLAGPGGGGYGIIGMRERVAALGGRLAVDQRVDVRGVTVSAAIPLPAAAIAPGRPETMEDGTR